LWDTFRALHPLLTLIQPRRQRDMVRSLIDTYRHTGWLPDARIAGRNGITQVGSSGDVVVADALVKGLRGIDWGTAYRALVKDADVDSPRPLRQGRELGAYNRLGYMGLEQGRSASRTLEYAYDDFAVSQVARALGHTADARRYLERSRRWAKLWDPDTLSIRPRYQDGRFLTPFSPDRYYPDGELANFDAPFYEGTAREWSTFVPHDTQGLIDRVGGDAAFVAWLDRLFDGGGYDPANEPALLAPYLYVNAGRQDLTVDRVHELLRTAYGAGRDGLPGNDDGGALSSWYVWSVIGLFPNAGQPWYYVGAPLFEKSEVSVGRGRRFVIEARRTGEGDRYVQAARLDGRPLERAWITHRELVRGGVLELEMGPHPSSFGLGARPPSPASGG
jgi:predicted alpha-1,2-mannosidase